MNTEINISNFVNAFFDTIKIQKTHPLQKYFSIERFFDGLQKDKSTFQEPKNWDDPFEDFISKLQNNNKNAYVSGLNITKGIYAQSWISKKSECDGMWRNFASLDDGVLIYTKAESIIESLFQYLIDIGTFDDNNHFKGRFDIQQQLKGSIDLRKVKYVQDKDIATLFTQKTESPHLDYNEVSLNLLSKKRKEFEYENEYRLFVKQELLKLPNDKYLELGYLTRIIDKIVFSPLMSEEKVCHYRKKLILEYHFKEEQVSKSNLYNIDAFRQEYNL